MRKTRFADEQVVAILRGGSRSGRSGGEAARGFRAAPPAVQRPDSHARRHSQRNVSRSNCAPRSRSRRSTHRGDHRHEHEQRINPDGAADQRRSFRLGEVKLPRGRAPLHQSYLCVTASGISFRAGIKANRGSDRSITSQEAARFV
jgi:hypothetical protein